MNPTNVDNPENNGTNERFCPTLEKWLYLQGYEETTKSVWNS